MDLLLQQKFVEVAGIEPASVGTAIDLLRAQLSGNFRDRHCCQRRQRSLVSELSRFAY